MDPLAAANMLLSQRRSAEALQAFARLSVQAPGHPLVLLGLAAAQARTGKREAALANIARVRGMKIADPLIEHNIAKAYIAELADIPTGLAILRAGHERWPQDVELRDDLIGVLSSTDHAAETVRLGRAALRAGPDTVKLRLSLAAGLIQQGDAPGCMEVLRGAHASWPADVKVLESLARSSVYDPACDGAAVLGWHRAHAEALQRAVGPALPPVPAGSAPGGRVLGVLSPDFKKHSVAHFSLPLLSALAARGWRIVCYYTAETQDDMTRRFRALPVTFVECPFVPPRELAARVRADGVGVLLDLAGLSAGHRLSTLLLRPAPVQATYLGYAATTGAAAVDLRLVDDRTDPPGAEAHASERLVRLPGCFVCYQPQEGVPEPGTGPGAGPGEAARPFTFGSFNALLKLCDPTVALWAEVLQAAPGARLLLKTGALTDPGTRDHTLARFERVGVEPSRLDLRGWTDDPGHHLSLYDQVDVALDPVTYHGTTTTCEAMLMGVPVLSLQGARHASRVGGSLLRTAGLEAWAVDGAAELVGAAARAAAAGPRGLTPRREVRERFLASPLCDAAGCAKRLEAVLLGVWPGGRAPG